MASTIPPPPKQGGSGPFIIAAVVMLLLMGGLIYWKMSGDGSRPMPPTPVAVATAPMLDDPPPPPPPEEAPLDAGTQPKQATKKNLSGGAAVGGCGGECKGDASGTLRAQLAAKGAQGRGCYERALRQNAQLQGRMRVAVRISGTGSVCRANVTLNEIGDSAIATCVTQIFRSSTFAPPQGGCVDAEVPLRFEPKI
jgi:hypothetical protein